MCAASGQSIYHGDNHFCGFAIDFNFINSFVIVNAWSIANESNIFDFDQKIFFFKIKWRSWLWFYSWNYCSIGKSREHIHQHHTKLRMINEFKYFTIANVRCSIYSKQSKKFEEKNSVSLSKRCGVWGMARCFIFIYLSSIYSIVCDLCKNIQRIWPSNIIKYNFSDFWSCRFMR